MHLEVFVEVATTTAAAAPAAAGVYDIVIVWRHVGGMALLERVQECYVGLLHNSNIAVCSGIDSHLVTW